MGRRSFIRLAGGGAVLSALTAGVPAGGQVQMSSRTGHPKGDLPPAPRRGLAAQMRSA